jgi:hypothetical protein
MGPGIIQIRFDFRSDYGVNIWNIFELDGGEAFARPMESREKHQWPIH